MRFFSERILTTKLYSTQAHIFSLFLSVSVAPYSSCFAKDSTLLTLYFPLFFSLSLSHSIYLFPFANFFLFPPVDLSLSFLCLSFSPFPRFIPTYSNLNQFAFYTRHINANEYKTSKLNYGYMRMMSAPSNIF